MIALEKSTEFRDIAGFSAETGISQENLMEVFRIENKFHREILETESPTARVQMYAKLYAAVHPLLRPGAQTNVGGEEPSREREARELVLLFSKELEGKSVLEVGCGDGRFLSKIHELLPHGDLLGLDTSDTGFVPSNLAPGAPRFVRQDIVSFALDRTFDVAFSCQVLEHLAPPDLPEHLRAVSHALAPGGVFIVLLPNRFWGPSDITRIIDNTYMGRVPAQGSHLNESSYTELVPLLQRSGFTTIRTVLPFAQALPFLRPVRIKPRINTWIEGNRALLAIARGLRRHGRPLFRNPVILICQKTLDPAACTERG